MKTFRTRSEHETRIRKKIRTLSHLWKHVNDFVKIKNFTAFLFDCLLQSALLVALGEQRIFPIFVGHSRQPESISKLCFHTSLHFNKKNNEKIQHPCAGLKLWTSRYDSSWRYPSTLFTPLRFRECPFFRALRKLYDSFHELPYSETRRWYCRRRPSRRSTSPKGKHLEIYTKSHFSSYILYKTS